MWSTTAVTKQDRNVKRKKYSELLFHQVLASNIIKYNAPFLHLYHEITANFFWGGEQ